MMEEKSIFPISRDRLFSTIVSISLGGRSGAMPQSSVTVTCWGSFAASAEGSLDSSEAMLSLYTVLVMAEEEPPMTFRMVLAELSVPKSSS